MQSWSLCRSSFEVFSFLSFLEEPKIKNLSLNFQIIICSCSRLCSQCYNELQNIQNTPSIIHNTVVKCYSHFVSMQRRTITTLTSWTITMRTFFSTSLCEFVVLVRCQLYNVKTQVSCAKYDIFYHWQQHLSKAIFVYFTSSLINTNLSLPGAEISYRHLPIAHHISRKKTTCIVT